VHLLKFVTGKRGQAQRVDDKGLYPQSLTTQCTLYQLCSIFDTHSLPSTITEVHMLTLKVCLPKKNKILLLYSALYNSIKINKDHIYKSNKYTCHQLSIHNYTK